MDTLEKILNLMKDNNCDNQQLAIALGLNRQVVTDWRAGRSKSYKKYLYQIADYFNVSVDYLLGNAPKNTITLLNDDNIYMIPVYESVSAGFGAYAANEVIEYMPCYLANKFEAEETLYIKVSGDSMYPKIEDNDIIQVRKQTSVDSGSIAVILLDKTEGLVKKVVYGDNWIELHSLNPIYPVQRYVDEDIARIEVLGLVKKVIKNI